MAKLDSFRKLIREEVRAVFQEELATILKEAIISNKQTITETKTSSRSSIPGTLNTQPVRKLAPPVLSPNNPLNSLLTETAYAMSGDDMETFSYNSTDVPGFAAMPGYDREAPVVDSVSQMLNSARPSSNLDAIQINAVPDYSAIMAKMQQNGEL